METPKNISQHFPLFGKSYHLPLVPFRPVYDAPQCIIRGEPEGVVLSDQRKQHESA